MNTAPRNTTDAAIDPTAIIKERKEREAREAANALIAKQAENRRLNLEHADKVPELVDQAVAGLTELYELYKTFDYPAFKRATLTRVLDREATAKKAAADGAQKAQPKKRTLWDRLFPKAVIEYQLSPRDQLIINQVSKETACWMLGSISRTNAEDRLRFFFLEAQTGTVYVTPPTIHEGIYADVLDPEHLKLTLSYLEATELHEMVQREIKSIKSDIRWARQDAEREARQNEVPTQSAGDAS